MHAGTGVAAKLDRKYLALHSSQAQQREKLSVAKISKNKRTRLYATPCQAAFYNQTQCLSPALFPVFHQSHCLVPFPKPTTIFLIFDPILSFISYWLAATHSSEWVKLKTLTRPGVCKDMNWNSHNSRYRPGEMLAYPLKYVNMNVYNNSTHNRTMWKQPRSKQLSAVE